MKERVPSQPRPKQQSKFYAAISVSSSYISSHCPSTQEHIRSVGNKEIDTIKYDLVECVALFAFPSISLTSSLSFASHHSQFWRFPNIDDGFCGVTIHPKGHPRRLSPCAMCVRRSVLRGLAYNCGIVLNNFLLIRVIALFAEFAPFFFPFPSPSLAVKIFFGEKTQKNAS